MSPTDPNKFQRGINSRKNTWKNTKVKNFLYYVNTNSYPKFDVNILLDRQRKVLKTKFKQKKISGVQSGQTQ